MNDAGTLGFIVKVCGLTKPEDVAEVHRAGGNAIGLNFWPRSKRFVEDGLAREILAAKPVGMKAVGVFVNAHPLVVEETLQDLGLDAVQLHGNERLGDFSKIDREKLVRAVRVQDEASLAEALGWKAHLFLYEGFSKDFGGTGEVAPWNMIGGEGTQRPFLLAGGLTADNVAAGIAATNPDGVDVASGVESAPGIKDPEKIHAFAQAALQAAQKVRAAGEG